MSVAVRRLGEVHGCVDLWLTESFIYYLHLNTTKSLASYSQQLRSPLANLTDDYNAKDAFYKKGISVATSIGRKELQPKFFAMRILVYSAKDYDENEDVVRSIISSHTLGRVYCIPLVLDKLTEQVTPDDRQLLEAVAARCGQPFDLKVPPRSRAHRFWHRLTGAERRRVIVPDLLLVNGNVATSRPDRMQPPAEIWWYGQHSQDVEHSSTATDIERAQRVFHILCRHVSDCLWDQYTPETVGRVPVVLNESGTDSELFFSLPYYEAWLEWIRLNCNNPHQALARVLGNWLTREEEQLLAFMKGNERVLDVGCGTGRHADLILQNNKCSSIAGVEINANLLVKASRLIAKYGRDHVSFTVDDAAGLVSCRPHEFDLIICMTNTLGNLVHDKQVAFLKRAATLLTPEGKLIVSVYSDSEVSVRARKTSYEEIGLEAFIRENGQANVIETAEGLRSEHFRADQLRTLFEKDCGLVLAQDPQSFAEIGLWVVASRQATSGTRLT